jgi:DmsE family decaheme c-type cytochrome
MMHMLLKRSSLSVVVWVALLAAVEGKEVDWAAIHPGFAGASFVKDKQVCNDCHEASVLTYQHTEHARIFEHGPKGELQALDCESCHGPRSKHIEEPDDSLAMSGKEYSTACLQCHQEGSRMHWQGSLHNMADVNCLSCHSVMQKRSVHGLLAAADETSVCYTCHAEVRGQMMKASHHPVREGQMSCSSCHDPHGSVGPSMLQRATVNETCFGCHQEKRGPFVWEHPVVRDNCSNCHEAHGSNNADMLNAKGAFLCMQCHSYGGHINLPRYNRVSNPNAQGCVNCHSTQHGSNHPSGAKFTR